MREERGGEVSGERYRRGGGVLREKKVGSVSGGRERGRSLSRG